MPVRLLSSSTLTWPDAQQVDAAFRRWIESELRRRGGVLCAGYFGSYARGDWGVGSDLDVVLIVDWSELPFQRRPLEWETTALPVPMDLLVYTADEWRRLDPASRFARTLAAETVWVYERAVRMCSGSEADQLLP